MCKLFRRLYTFILCAIMLMAFGTAAEAADNHDKGKIIFIPHDNRPVSDQQAADTIRNLGYEVIVPPDNMLGGRDFLGDPGWRNRLARERTLIRRKILRLL